MLTPSSQPPPFSQLRTGRYIDPLVFPPLPDTFFDDHLENPPCGYFFSHAEYLSESERESFNNVMSDDDIFDFFSRGKARRVLELIIKQFSSPGVDTLDRNFAIFDVEKGIYANTLIISSDSEDIYSDIGLYSLDVIISRLFSKACSLLSSLPNLDPSQADHTIFCRLRTDLFERRERIFDAFSHKLLDFDSDSILEIRILLSCRTDLPLTRAFFGEHDNNFCFPIMIDTNDSKYDYRNRYTGEVMTQIRVSGYHTSPSSWRSPSLIPSSQRHRSMVVDTPADFKIIEYLKRKIKIKTTCPSGEDRQMQYMVRDIRTKLSPSEHSEAVKMFVENDWVQGCDELFCSAVKMVVETYTNLACKTKGSLLQIKRYREKLNKKEEKEKDPYIYHFLGEHGLIFVQQDPEDFAIDFSYSVERFLSFLTDSPLFHPLGFLRGSRLRTIFSLDLMLPDINEELDEGSLRQIHQIQGKRSEAFSFLFEILEIFRFFYSDEHSILSSVSASDNSMSQVGSDAERLRISIDGLRGSFVEYCVSMGLLNVPRSEWQFPLGAIWQHLERASRLVTAVQSDRGDEHRSFWEREILREYGY